MQTNMPARAVTILAIAAALAGCSPSTPATTAPSPDAVAGAMAAAKAAGADPSQIALFEDGAISYADYETAINRYASCARDAGYTVTIDGTRSSQGVTVLNYTLTVPTGKTSALSDACYDKFAKFVDMYWQASSPDAIAFSDRREKALKPQLRDCLSKYKVDVPADASFDELIKAAVDHLQKDGSQNCMDDIGYGAWQG
jgi:hypothetical protein